MTPRHRPSVSDQVRPGDRVVVVSPHLDDAVLSLGATMAHLAEQGVVVRVVTVFGGDPQQEREAGPSNLRAGFATTGQAARRRRAEDAAACARLGVEAVHLPFDDDESSPRDEAALGAALRPVLADADLVLVPGDPLVHGDHLLVARLTTSTPTRARVALYREQPYAAWRALSRSGAAGWRTAPSTAPADGVGRQDALAWRRSSACVRCRRRKLAAAGAYRSQLAVLRRWPRLRIAAHELLTRGERIAWPRGTAG